MCQGIEQFSFLYQRPASTALSLHPASSSQLTRGRELSLSPASALPASTIQHTNTCKLASLRILNLKHSAVCPLAPLSPMAPLHPTKERKQMGERKQPAPKPNTTKWVMEARLTLFSFLTFFFSASVSLSGIFLSSALPMVKLRFGDSFKIDEFERRKKTYESFFGLFKCQFVSVLFERQVILMPSCQAAESEWWNACERGSENSALSD